MVFLIWGNRSLLYFKHIFDTALRSDYKIFLLAFGHTVTDLVRFSIFKGSSSEWSSDIKIKSNITECCTFSRQHNLLNVWKNKFKIHSTVLNDSRLVPLYTKYVLFYYKCTIRRKRMYVMSIVKCQIFKIIKKMYSVNILKFQKKT